MAKPIREPSGKEPGFPGVTARQLRSLATKIAKLDDEHRIRKALEAAAGADEQQVPLAWHLIVHGHLDASAHDALLEVLAASELDEPRARVVASMLARRSATESQHASWLPGWTTALDTLVFEADALAPEAFTALAHELAPPMRLGLAFVRGRRGRPVDADVGRHIARALAEAEATGYGISGNGSLLVVDASGAGVAHDTMEETGLRDLALRFCTREEWDALLQAAAMQNRWGLIEHVRPALEQLPLASLSRLLATRGHQRLLSDSSDATRTMLAILDARGDAPEALLARPDLLPESEDDAAVVRELYAVTAVRRLVAQGRPVPTEALDVLGGFRLLTDRLAADAALEALRALPADRVLVRVREALPKAWNGAPIGALGAHFDAAILDGALATDDHLDDELLGLLGGPAVEPLGAAARRAAREDTRVSRTVAMVRAMARAVTGGVVPPPSWDALLADVVEHGAPRSGLGAITEPLAQVLAAVAAARGAPEEAAQTLVAPRGGAAVRSRWAVVDRLVTAAHAVDPSAACIRMYLLHQADDLHPARAGSLSRIAGRAAAVDDVNVPKNEDGEPYDHLLTLDVDDVPELAAKYPGARGIALFCLERETGDHNEELELVTLPAAAAPGVASVGSDAAALAVHRIDVPASVFAPGPRPRVIQELREAIGSAGGHVLGRPLWIQAYDGDDGGLLLQINDGLVDGLNLGDVGSLYVFEDGSSVYHSH